MKYTRILLAGALSAAALLLTGCVPTTAPPDATESAEPVPVPTITVTPDPSARTADSPLEPIDAYALCKAQTIGFYVGDPGLVTFADFASSMVVLRDDGKHFVYVEASDGNREPALVDVGASNCIVGGVMGAPEWTLFGSMVRVREAELEGMVNMPGETG
ncbi:hypothetical protein E3O25_09220 [Cryobacterium sp. TMT1-3]|uniref:hypothetical protein n=1 Tax=Cryobacterium sp. TMT1-3 TaxID=1259237 RepID=UPI00106937F0|nr:hypothetical protein [Cryobacterium sp. TMT1-3]TFC27293.1 hypothetical protein E3O25_09220 [Cryobacterium sp. TMT1-3]